MSDDPRRIYVDNDVAQMLDAMKVLSQTSKTDLVGMSLALLFQSMCAMCRDSGMTYAQALAVLASSYGPDATDGQSSAAVEEAVQ